MAEAVRAHQAEIADEVLATEVTEDSDASTFHDAELGLGFTLAKV